MASQETPLLTPEEFSEIKNIVKNIEGWKSVDNVQVHKMGVPSANKILRLENPDAEKYPNVVLKCPLINPFSELFDLSEQNQVNNMITSHRGKQGLNPQVFFCNEKYRIEEFVKCTTMPYSAYQDEVKMKELAEIMCRFHYDAEIKKKYIDLRGPNTLKKRMLGMREVFVKNYASKPKLIEQIVPEEFQQLYKNFFDEIEVLCDNQYFTKLMDYLFQDLKQGEETMSHNDTHMFNIIVVDDHLQLIDFDGSNLSYPGCDIGSIYRASFMDFTQGFKPNPDKAWTPTQKRTFISNYLTYYYNNVLQNKEKSLSDFLSEEVPKMEQSAERGYWVAVLFWLFLGFSLSSLVMYEKFIGWDKLEIHLKNLQDLKKLI